MQWISHNSSSVPWQGEGESAVPFHPRNEKAGDLTWQVMEQQWENQNENSELLMLSPVHTFRLLGQRAPLMRKALRTADSLEVAEED